MDQREAKVEGQSLLWRAANLRPPCDLLLTQLSSDLLRVVTPS